VAWRKVKSIRAINDNNLRLQYYKKHRSLWNLLEDERRGKIRINNIWQTCRRHLQQSEMSTSGHPRKNVGKC
jgi:hypothetical protein